jgi:AraC-like DNA-binding protein
MITIKNQNSFELAFKQSNDISIGYHSSGCYKARSNGFYKEPAPECFELIFVARGEIRIAGGEKNTTLTENDIFIIPPYSEKGLLSSEDTDTIAYWCQFTASDISRVGITELSDRIENAVWLRDIFDRLVLWADSPERPAYWMDLMTSLLLVETACAQKGIGQKDKGIVRQTGEWLEENISASTTVEDIADSLGYDKDYLNKIFRKAKNVNLKAYINSLKIRKAKDLLMHSEFTIQKIAEMMGFESSNLFIKFFKYHMKITPSEFRKNCQR